jgi:hypothetical protein
MSSRDSRARFLMVIPGLVLLAWLLVVTIVALRGASRGKGWLGVHDRGAAGRDGRSRAVDEWEAGPAGLDDPRLSSLHRAAESWRQSVKDERLVVNQVCLVPDVPAFLEAIAAWDDHHFFPILIDEPVWTLPFLRAFRPARVFRYAGPASPTEATRLPARPRPPASREAEWSSALEAVARACSGQDQSDAEIFSGDSPAGRHEPAAPGMVLAAPESPMLAGAVALAAGHFQPLVLLEPYDGTWSPGRAPPRFGDVLTLLEAWDFARRVEGRVATVAAHFAQLGDDCDFLTIAGDWPYRYSNEAGVGPAGGVFALDDLIGRRLEGGPSQAGLARSRRRWAYAGRLLGDPAASVARAMAALFLKPSAALLWNTYTGGIPKSDYTMSGAARLLGSALPGSSTVVHRAGRQADLMSWHRAVSPLNRFGLLLINSSGGPDFFSITGGPGRPADVPRGIPTAVAMIHSFSAVNPADPETLAGRWLAQGAFIYFGSVNEPFLPAFRRPRLVAELMAAEVPMVAALRQGEFEAFGFPWRLVYLGDPLYRLDAAAPARGRPVAARAQPATSDGSRKSTAPLRRLSNWSNGESGAVARVSERLGPSEWRKVAPEDARWPVVEIAPPAASGPPPPAEQRVVESEAERLHWCLDAAIGETTQPRARLRPAPEGDGDGRSAPGVPPVDWRMVLRQVRRDRLDSGLRRHFDDLLIDALEEIGACDELMSRLAQIPSEECGPRVWAALESCATQRLAKLARESNQAASFERSLVVWDEVMRLSWPKGSPFPAQLTERVAALAAAGSSRRSGPWLDRLRRTGDALAAHPDRFPHAAVIATERARLQALSGRR